MKIFGEEHFIDNTMLEIVEDYGNKLDKIVFDEMTKTIKYTMPEVKVDEQKLRDWIVLCMKLENIDKSDLVDIAVKKKFADKNEQLAIYKRAFELVCEEIANNEQGKTNAWLQIQHIRNKFGISAFQSYNDYYLDQAKKELEEEDVKNS